MSGVPKFPGLTAYAAIKAAVIALSEGLAGELREQGIRVLSLSPGAVNTEMLRGIAPEFAPQAMDPAEAGEAIALLLEEGARGIGQGNVPLWGSPRVPAC